MSSNQVELEVVYAKTRDDMLAAALRVLGQEKQADAEAVADLVVGRFKALQGASDDLTSFFTLENINDLGVAEFREELTLRAHKLVSASALDIKVLALEVLEIAILGAGRRTKQ